MGSPEIPSHVESGGEQERRLGLARQITAVLKSQVSEVSKGALARDAAWLGEVAKGRSVTVKYIGFCGRKGSEEATVVNEKGLEEATSEITYERTTKYAGSGIQDSNEVTESLVVQSGLEERRSALTAQEAQLLEQTRNALVEAFGLPEQVEGPETPPTA